MDELFEISGVKYKGILTYDHIKIPSGKISFVVGESGSGKSTLLKLLNRTISPDQGEISYKGKSILKGNLLQLRQDVLLFNQKAFLFDGSIRDNFYRYYAYRGIDLPKKETMREMLDLFGLSFSLSQNCTVLSGGERHRVYMAIYLSFIPEVILLDEPTAALDAKNSDIIMRNFIDFCKRKGIELIVVSHDQDIVNAFAEHVVRIGG